MVQRLFICVGLLCAVACTKDRDTKIINDFPVLMEIPPHFPEMDIPVGNEFSRARWELGKKLFFEKALSLDSSISCSSCHLPSLAFSDSVSVSTGFDGRKGRRNSPSLANVGFHPYYTREGGLPTLEMQVLVPIQEHDEFNHNIVKIVESLSQVPEYESMAQEAYGRTFDAFVLTRSLANFERSLISGWSRYDQYLNGQVELTEEESHGEALFFSEALKCGNCHSGVLFTDFAFRSNGLYEEYDDYGRFRLTGLNEDKGVFKTPSLRNIEVTSPYMHDGSLTNLDAVIDHYASGGADHINMDAMIQSFAIDEDQRDALKAFLHTLTDNLFLENPIFMTK